MMFALPALGAVALLVARGRGASPTGAASDDQRSAHLAALPELAPAMQPAPESPDVVAKRAEAAIATWRTGVVSRDADKVVELERAFSDAPAAYVEGLKTRATVDENERVRAFAARELGKFKRGDLAPTFERLLDDENPYVRKNAAWALGELGTTAEGRTEARRAEAQLRQIARRDPEPSVRVAARSALDGIE